MRAAALACLLATACSDSTSKPDTFPGDEVTPRWLLQGEGESNGVGIIVLPDGDLVVAVMVSPFGGEPRLTIGGESFSFETTAGLVLLKLSAADGTLLSSAAFEGIAGAAQIAPAPDGDVFIGGLFGDPIDLGGGPVMAGDGLGHLVARLSGDDLSHVWSRALDVTANLAGFDLSVTADGDVLATNEDGELLHVERLSSVDGATVWSSDPVAGDGEGADSVELPDGDIAVTGIVRNIDGVIEPIVLRLDGEDGSFVWSEIYPAAGDGAGGTAIGLLDDDLLVVGGSYGSLMLGDTILSGGFDAFAARITQEGELVWGRDICDHPACYAMWPIPLRLLGSTVAMTVYEAGDEDIEIRTLTSDGDLGDATVLASSDGEAIGAIAAGGDSLYLTGRSGSMLSMEPDDIVWGSVFVLSL